jgi:anti-sigma factor RsiW
MSHPCPEHALDALLAGELSAEDAQRVRAHAEGCAACQHTLSWLKLERGWMAQRARREPARPALDFAALEARLHQASAPKAPPSRPAPRRARWAHRGMMAVASMAAAVFFVFSVAQQSRPVAPAYDELASWGESEALLFTPARGEVCTDPVDEAVAALEARVGACLLASPALAVR